MVDVRTAEEVRELGVIGSAIHIPLDQLTEHLDKLPNPESSIVVYCEGGVRSAKAVEVLAGHGFTNVSDLEGGIVAWLDAGYSAKPAKQVCCAESSPTQINTGDGIDSGLGVDGVVDCD